MRDAWAMAAREAVKARIRMICICRVLFFNVARLERDQREGIRAKNGLLCEVTLISSADVLNLLVGVLYVHRVEEDEDMGFFADQKSGRVAELSAPSKQCESIRKTWSYFAVDEILELCIDDFGV